MLKYTVVYFSFFVYKNLKFRKVIFDGIIKYFLLLTFNNRLLQMQHEIL